jgi:hypothetical protein
MPLYFFHLTFGDRVALDEEGVELPDRSAACAEARAVVRDLCDPATGDNSRRWASWFLLVADSRGAFLRAALGHPALQVVSNDPGGPSVGSHLPLAGTTAAMAEEHSALRHRTERNRQLRSELSAESQDCKETRWRAVQLVSFAWPGLPTACGDECRTAAKPARRSPPELVLLPGGL